MPHLKDLLFLHLRVKLKFVTTLNQDFPTEVQRTPKKSHFMVSDTDSDFESPNLLVKSRTRNPKPSNNVKLIPENKKKEIPKKEEKIKNGVKETDDFDLFASPEKTEAVDTKPKKLKKVKSIRWIVDDGIIGIRKV